MAPWLLPPGAIEEALQRLSFAGQPDGAFFVVPASLSSPMPSPSGSSSSASALPVRYRLCLRWDGRVEVVEILQHAAGGLHLPSARRAFASLQQLIDAYASDAGDALPVRLCAPLQHTRGASQGITVHNPRNGPNVRRPRDRDRDTAMRAEVREKGSRSGGAGRGKESTRAYARERQEQSR
jgi:hypothetical protein